MSNAAPQGSCSLGELPAKRTSKGRVIAIGDLHGDVLAAKAVLLAAKVVDEAGRWVGGNTTVVQLGDVLDRGDTEQEIMDWFSKLETEASKAGGEFIWLLGNHELMNAAGDFRYVTPGGFGDFDDVVGLNLADPHLERVPQKAKARVAVFSPGGTYAKLLAKHNVIAIIDDVVYSHAGVLGPWVTQVDAVNREARCWLEGTPTSLELPLALTAQQGPAWTRALGLDPPDCDGAKAALKALGAKRMVVAHTVQDKGANAVCDGTVWRIDVGLGKLYDGPIQALELPASGEPTVVVGKRL